jgi:hypothetical protein
MKTVVVALHSPTSEGRKRRAAGTDAEWLALKPIQQPDAANRHILFDFMTSIWCGAMMGCIGAAVIPYLQRVDDEGIRASRSLQPI